MTLQAALMTPAGSGGIAVVRLAGEQTHRVLNQIVTTRSPIVTDSVRDNRLHFGYLHDGQEKLDQVVVACHSSLPQADINLHGGPRIIQRLLMLLQGHGAQIRPWQELVGGSGIELEVALNLPLAQTPLAVLAIAAQYPGGLNQWCSQAISNLQDDRWTLEQFRQEVSTLLDTWPLGRRLLNPARAVIAGAPNAGKSTLANALAGHTQSLTADLAGTTRDWTQQVVDINGIPVLLVDTAGRRDSSDPLEQAALQQADRQLAQADLIILLAGADTLTAEQLAQQECYLPPAIPRLTVINKIDLAANQPAGACDAAISAQTGAGLDQLKQAVAHQLGFSNFTPASPLLFTQRQYDILNRARQARNEYYAILELFMLFKAPDETGFTLD